MPALSLWFIGFGVGLEMLLDDVALIGVTIGLRSLPNPAPFLAKAA